MFCVSLFNELSKLKIEAIDLNKFITAYIDTLNNHASSKKKYIRGNHLPFMNKELSKEIMHTTRLWNNFLRKLSGKQPSLFSDETPSDEKITLTEKHKIINTDSKTADVSNTFFSTILSLVISLFLNIQCLVLFPMISMILS